MASKITGVLIVNSTVCSDTHQRKHQSSMSLAFVRGIHQWPVNSQHKGPVTWKMCPFDDDIMCIYSSLSRAVLVSSFCHLVEGMCWRPMSIMYSIVQTDGRTCRKTVTVGRVDQRTHVQVIRGYFRLRRDGWKDQRTDGWTDGRTTRKHNASGA